MMKSIIKSGRY